jgi:hypothetical protein
MEEHFDSAADALKYIEEQSPGLKRHKDDVLIFRGESNRYPTMQPSFLRQPEGAQAYHLSLISNFSQFILGTLLSPFLEFRSDGPYYKGKWFGNLEWVEKYGSGTPSYTDSKWQLESLLQHYGWPTPWLDITFDPRVAVFFAALDFSNRGLFTTGEGYVHIWSSTAIREAYLIFDTPLIDLKPVSDILADALGKKSTRPQAQAAGSIRLGFGNNSEPRLRSLRSTISFTRHDAIDVLHGFDHYFPQDALAATLNEFEGLYLDYCRSVPLDQTGEGWLEYIEFIEARRKTREY